jgi:hypothetical protein
MHQERGQCRVSILSDVQTIPQKSQARLIPMCVLITTHQMTANSYRTRPESAGPILKVVDGHTRKVDRRSHASNTHRASHVQACVIHGGGGGRAPKGLIGAPAGCIVTSARHSLFFGRCWASDRGTRRRFVLVCAALGSLQLGR